MEKRLNRLVWHHGMRVTPQHMQQQDLFHEAVLGARIDALTPHSWGVIALEIDPAALKYGSIRLAHFRGIMPDGYPLNFRFGNRGAPEERKFLANFQANAAALEIFLVLPNEVEETANYPESREDAARYQTHKTTCFDLTRALGKPEDLSFATPNVRLTFTGEPKKGCTSLKIAEIVRDEVGEFALSTSYIPPLLRLGASPVLVRALKKLVSLAVIKQRALAKQQSHLADGATEFSSHEITRYLKLSSINQYIPVLRHIEKFEECTPLFAYRVLLGFAGALTTFQAGADPSTLPAFLYSDLRATLLPLIETITGFLGFEIDVPFTEIKLASREDGMWLGRFDEVERERFGEFLFAIEVQNAPHDVTKSLVELANIASWNDINRVISSAQAPGAMLRFTSHPPKGIPARPGVLYFLIDSKSVESRNYWQRVVESGKVAIYFPPPFTPPQISIRMFGIHAAA